MKLLITISTFILIIASGCRQESTSPAVRHDEQKEKELSTILFHRVCEPAEKAFTFLLPDGWVMNGGIIRISNDRVKEDETTRDVKLYLKIGSPDNRIGMGWLPDNIMCDNTDQGIKEQSDYSAQDFILRVAIPFTHPHAENIEILQFQEFPKISQQLFQVQQWLKPLQTVNYDLSSVTFEYTDNWIRYHEKMIFAINRINSTKPGLSKNADTWYVRADKDIFTSWEPVFAAIRSSVKFSDEWLKHEFRCLLPGDQTTVCDEKVIGFKKQWTDFNDGLVGELFNDHWIIKGYLDPFSHEPEQLFSGWRHLWVNETGDVIVTDNDAYNPDHDANIRIRGYRKPEIIDDK